MVRMDASFGDGWFYEGAGIYRHVWLTKTDALHLGYCETYIRAAVKGAAAALTFSTIVQNEDSQAENCRVRWQVVDSSGKVVATADSPQQSVAPAPAKTNTPAAAPTTTPPKKTEPSKRRGGDEDFFEGVID